MAVIQWNDLTVMERVRLGVMRGVVRATEEVRNEAIRLILTTEKTGRIYRRRGIVHQASAPGEPPASDTGRLVNSATTEYDESRLAGTVSFNTEYAAFLEFGTTKMDARPFARPALMSKQADIVRLIDEEVNRALGAA